MKRFAVIVRSTAQVEREIRVEASTRREVNAMALKEAEQESPSNLAWQHRVLRVVEK